MAAATTTYHDEDNTNTASTRPANLKGRPYSANRALKSANQSYTVKEKNEKILDNSPLAMLTNLSREEIISSLLEAKKRVKVLEANTSSLRTENQRWQNEVRKIEKLLESTVTSQQSGGIGLGGTGERRSSGLAGMGGGLSGSFPTSTEARKELEKSLLVRQLKTQIIILRNGIVEKDDEIEALKKNQKNTKLMEISNEKEEYYLEALRLKQIVRELRDSLQSERQKRAWDNKRNGAGDEIRKEVARLTTGYQKMLQVISPSDSNNDEEKVNSFNRDRPASSRGHNKNQNTNQDNYEHNNNNKNVISKNKQRPQSATKNRAQTPSVNGGTHASVNAYITLHHASSSSLLAIINSEEQQRITEPLKLFNRQLSRRDKNNISNNTMATEPDELDFFTGIADNNEAFSSNINGFSSNMDKNGRNDYSDNIDTKNVKINRTNNVIIDKNVEYKDLNDEEKIVKKEIDNENNNNISNGNTNSNKSIDKVDKVSKISFKYRINDKVEGQYKGGSVWYSATIKSLNKDESTYHLLYDDGDEEKDMNEEKIRQSNQNNEKIHDSNGNNKKYVTENVDDTTNKFKNSIYKVKSKVEEIINERHNEINKEENRIMNKEILKVSIKETNKKVNKESEYQIGSTIEGKYGDGPEWFKGEIKKINYISGTYTYDILYDDDDEENDVVAKNIRYFNDNISNNISNDIVDSIGENIEDNIIDHIPTISYAINDINNPTENSNESNDEHFIENEIDYEYNNESVKINTFKDNNNHSNKNNEKNTKKNSDSSPSKKSVNSDNYLDNYLDDLSDDDDHPDSGISAEPTIYGNIETKYETITVENIVKSEIPIDKDNDKSKNEKLNKKNIYSKNSNSSCSNKFKIDKSKKVDQEDDEYGEEDFDD